MITEKLFKTHIESLAMTHGIAVLMRHAEREDIPRGEFGNNVNLTIKGIEDSQLLSVLLKNSLVNIYSSPVKRCIQTAELFAINASNSKINLSSLLGDPGIFIANCHEAQTYCLQNSVFSLVQELLTESINPPGFCESTTNAVYQLINYLLLQSGNTMGLSLFLTHDAIFSVVLGVIFKEYPIISLWPNYLEALFCWQRENQLHFIYRDLSKTILWTR